MFFLTHPVNFPCGRKPERPEKTHDFRQSVDGLFSHGPVARIEPTFSEVKGACSDDCVTEPHYTITYSQLSCKFVSWIRHLNAHQPLLCSPSAWNVPCITSIDILYTLDSASNYSAIQKLKPCLQTQDIPMKWKDSYVFYFLNRELKH
jgi:hypothetical protein